MMHHRNCTTKVINNKIVINMSPIIKITILGTIASLCGPTLAKNYYVQTTTKLNWFGAYETCQSLGYQLATITSQTEQDDINAAIKASGKPSEWMWTSGSDLTKTGSFVWMSTGTAFTYLNWAPAEPDNLGGKEFCVHLWPGVLKPYTWNDYPCSTTMFFICEDKICN